MILRSTSIVVVAVATSLSAQGSQSSMRSAEADLRKTLTAWQQAFDSRDAKAIAAFFSEDAFAMYGHPQPTIGRQANEQAWIEYYRRFTDHPVTAQEIELSASGDMAYVRGKYLLGPTSDPRSEGGRYISVWRLVDRKWLISALAARSYADVTGATYTAR